MIGSFDNVFKDKTVFVTGHTGFKGSWLSIWLKELGANVIGYSLEPYTPQDNFVVTGLESKITSNIGDIMDYERLKRVFDGCRPEMVFHLAAQPLVRLSYREPKLTYDTNIGGTVNLLECCRLSESVKVIVNVTSDKCYENKEWTWGYRENDALGGYDPYSSSKGCSEIISAAYRNSFFTGTGDRVQIISTVRAGNVIGGGDWREDRLIPDCIRSLKTNEAIGIRSPESVRPWQHVLDPIGGYLLLASKMYLDGNKYSGAWNFGPDHTSVTTVRQLVEKLLKYWGNGKYADLSEGSRKELHETDVLLLNISKAAHLLNWRPVLNLDEALVYTVNWYKKPRAGYDFCVSQINDYVGKMLKKQMAGT
jgi:CDP-glucose 4,6-dehydratase